MNVSYDNPGAEIRYQQRAQLQAGREAIMNALTEVGSEVRLNGEELVHATVAELLITANQLRLAAIRIDNLARGLNAIDEELRGL